MVIKDKVKFYRPHISLLIILAVGIIIRSAVLFYICAPGTLYPTMDEMNYRELAENILDHKLYSTWSEGYLTRSTRAPVYPVMIASSYVLFGNRGICSPKFLNFIFDIFIIYLVFLIGRKLFNTNIGLISAGIYSIFGHAPYFMQISSPHTLAVMLLMLVCLAMLYMKRSYWSVMPVFSIFYAVLIHTRPVFLVALPFVLPALYFQLSKKTDTSEKIKWLFDSWKQKLFKSVLAIAIVAILCLPWGIRNYMHHKTIVPVCTIAGWHIASNINFDMKLSIKYLTDNIYAPEHKEFSEADYFNLGKSFFFKSLREQHIKIPAFGFARLIYGWTPPGPIYRFLMPKAYIFPIYITDKIFIPLPDFEGMIYLVLFATIAALYFLRKKILSCFSIILYKGRGILIIMLGYSLVHIIGIPLIAYRFLLEPLLIIFGTVLLFQYILQLKGEKKEVADCESLGNKESLTVLYLISGILLLLIAIPLLHIGNPKVIPYPKVKVNGLSYDQLREIQWNNLGNIPENPRITVQGVAKYIHKGFKFPEDDYYAEKDANSAAGRLYVKYGDKETPIGTGDVRLNFQNIELPENGDAVTISGTATTGLFKEIIIDVDKIHR